MPAPTDLTLTLHTLPPMLVYPQYTLSPLVLVSLSRVQGQTCAFLTLFYYRLFFIVRIIKVWRNKVYNLEKFGIWFLIWKMERLEGLPNAYLVPFLWKQTPDF